jgi:uncharacterized lipoprotein YajG
MSSRSWFFRLAAVLALAFTTAGCALTPMTLETRPFEPEPVADAGHGRTIALVAPFVDHRPQVYRCGMKKNAYGFDTADVSCSPPPDALLALLLAQELEAWGFRVLVNPTAEEVAAAPPLLIVHGELRQYFVEPVVNVFTVSPEADIEVRLTATSPAGLVAVRNFYVKGTETGFSGAEYNIQFAHDKAVHDVVLSLGKAIVGLANRYPVPAGGVS